MFDPFIYIHMLVHLYLGLFLSFIRNKNVGQFVVSSKKVCFISGFFIECIFGKIICFFNQNSSRNPLHSAYQNNYVMSPDIFWVKADGSGLDKDFFRNSYMYSDQKGRWLCLLSAFLFIHVFKSPQNQYSKYKIMTKIPYKLLV